MREVVIVDMARSGVGKHGGSLKDVRPLELLSQVAAAVVNRNQAKIKKDMYDYVIMGQVKQNSECSNIARHLALNIGLPEEVPGMSLTIACGSGLQSIVEGAEMIENGFADVILAGGVEVMSGSEFHLSYQTNQAWGSGPVTILDSIVAGGPGAAPINMGMGLTAEKLVEIHNIPREEQDQFGLRSQVLALKAITNGEFKAEIIPIEYKKADGTCGLFAVDEYPRATTLEAMGKLKGAFKKDGTVTAGNSSGRNDGAAVALIMSREKAEELGIKPKARFVAAGVAGVEASIMGRGPVPATKIAMDKAGLTLKDMNVIELNEAFAGQALAVYREWEQDWGVTNEFFEERVNPWGGAIAIGHPLGGSGAIITTKLLYGMERKGAKYGLSTMCCAGGIGVAAIIERLD